ncbi:hypothetical protein BT93_H3375 [Corymbia citriodora subsp. variegata]|nr:hypothetical protein BT93_H3375 [Corymbia citriodora subsp. variegata]
MHIARVAVVRSRALPSPAAASSASSPSRLRRFTGFCKDGRSVAAVAPGPPNSPIRGEDSRDGREESGGGDHRRDWFREEHAALSDPPPQGLHQIWHRRGHSAPPRRRRLRRQVRVAQELGVKLGEEVGYAIRFEDRTSERTKIKYLTDGVLLRESLSNPELSEYSVIILDEAHERSLNTDILLGLMKRLVKIRSSKLRVLITSATLDGNKVSNFFSDCPVLNVPGKLYPVEIVYSRERPKSYLESSLRTALNIHVREPEGDVLIFMTGQDDIDKLVSKLEDEVLSLEEGSCMDAIILPLHGSLPPESQVRVFTPPPPNCRRFIVATNIAETSLTVDGVVYVIDSGYVKQRGYNPSTGMYSLDVVQVSKVQADQRAGRAGRTRPGKCYRLYPSTVYQDEFLDVTVPEIQRSSLTGSVLYLKSLDLSDIDILRFDFLDPPSHDSLEDALKQLYLIDAIDENGSITSIGQTMSELPLEPSLSRTLMEANEYGCLSQALTIAAMLSAETSLLPGRRFGGCCLSKMFGSSYAR